MTATNYEVNSGISVSAINITTGHMPRGTSEELAQQSINAPNSPSSSSSTSKNNGDSTFEPTVDMMVNDFDDEQTLEEEEALAASEAEDPSTELSHLQKESDMPIEELLALYNCAGRDEIMNRYPTTKKSTAKSRRMTSTSSSNLEVSDTINEHEEEEEFEDADEEEEEEDGESKEASQLCKLYPETYGNSGDKRLLRTISRQQSDEEDDGDYSPDEDEFKKTIMVGSEFQAVIPEGFFKYDDVLPYENEDKLLWDPTRLSEKQTEDYLQKAHQARSQQPASGVDAIPLGSHLKDDEQALHLLLQCGHNTEEALRRKRINAVPSTEQMSIWSEEECRNFENGIRVYGKDFHTIKQTKVRTRSVGELVQFYYLWKKTERHDVFANKARLDKKKYSLHPGLTDYMDRFLEEQDGNNGNVNASATQRDRSSSPSAVNCLLQSDLRRSVTSSTTANQKTQQPETSSSYHHRTAHSSTSLKDPLAVDQGDVVYSSGITSTTDIRHPMTQ